MCAGISSLVFLFIVGLSEYAVALAFVVALLDVIPMIGATIGAIIVTAIGFAEDPKIGIACLIFYLVYQQVENYVIYPRVMSRSVDIPGAVTVIAALGMFWVRTCLFADSVCCSTPRSAVRSCLRRLPYLRIQLSQLPVAFRTRLSKTLRQKSSVSVRSNPREHH